MKTIWFGLNDRDFKKVMDFMLKWNQEKPDAKISSWRVTASKKTLVVETRYGIERVKMSKVLL